MNDSSQHTNTGVAFRRIEPRDDPLVAAIIRRVMPEFGADGPGFAIRDPEVDAMCRAYSGANSVYLVVERDGVVVGGGGIAPLRGGHNGVCELQKMYFLPELRGRGIGRALLCELLERARALGFRTCYLETLTGMDAAQRLYVSLGFKPRCAPLGNTGHSSCDRWYELDLGAPAG
ncbi:MAG: GNAT family N-acetyltransferase [Planctomycetota bacterium]|nr:MAG: GNAT family N-acetyltransferase [Planctomycetota bacterium]